MNNRLKAILLMSPLVFASIIFVIVFLLSLIIEKPLISGIIFLLLLGILAFLKGLGLYIKYEREGE